MGVIELEMECVPVLFVVLFPDIMCGCIGIALAAFICVDVANC